MENGDRAENGKHSISANGLEINIFKTKSLGDFVSLTDIAKFKTEENPGYAIQNWMRNRNTVRFLALWERFHNPDFNYTEFEAIEKEADVLNVAMFDMTAQERRVANPDKKGNIRDYATISELICLANMEDGGNQF